VLKPKTKTAAYGTASPKIMISQCAQVRIIWKQEEGNTIWWIRKRVDGLEEDQFYDVKRKFIFVIQNTGISSDSPRIPESCRGWRLYCTTVDVEIFRLQRQETPGGPRDK